jgi:hypothetical protein
VAVLNTRWYGSPLRSGYGALSGLYSFSYAPPNLQRYLSWLLDLHSPIVCAAFIAPFFGRVKRAWWLLAFCASVLLSYIFYFVFDGWPFLRFMLPALPLLFVLTGAVIARVVDTLPLAWKRAGLLLVCTALAALYLFTAHRIGVFAYHQSEQRYLTIGEYAGAHLPANAAVIAGLHSGSMRMYGNRATIRWPWVPPGHLDEALNVLRAHGYEPYILLDQYEEAEFRTRYGEASVFGRIDWPPAVEYRGNPHVRLYALQDRARYLRGERIATETTGPP